MENQNNERVKFRIVFKDRTTIGLTHNLFFCIFVGAEQVDCLHVPKVDVMAQQEDEKQLADILLLAVTIQGFIS